MIVARPAVRCALFVAWLGLIGFFCIGFMIEASAEGNIPYVLSGFVACILLMLCIGGAALAAWLTLQASWRVGLGLSLGGTVAVGVFAASAPFLAILPWWIVVGLCGPPGALAAVNAYGRRTDVRENA